MNDVVTIEILKVVITIFASVMASSGFWMYMAKKNDRKDFRDRLLVGLAHDRIVYLSLKYIERGWLTQDEHENLVEYLYKPYCEMGGNGTAKKLIDEVNKLPFRSTQFSITTKEQKNDVK